MLWSISALQRRAPRKPLDRAAGPPARNNPPDCPPERHMPVGLLTLELHIPDAQSLKDKRQVLRSLKDKLRRDFNVAGGGQGDNETREGGGGGGGGSFNKRKKIGRRCSEEF